MPFAAVAVGFALSSTNEFHLPQSGHFPSHLRDWFPQS
jgi:hypothetical protein